MKLIHLIRIRSYGAKTVRRSSYTVDSLRQYTVHYLERSLSKHLTDHAFVQNKYDMCTFNKMMNSEQVIVQFHVDDLKFSHNNQSVLDDFLNKLRSEF